MNVNRILSLGLVVVVLSSGCTSSTSVPGTTHTYYIAADEVVWDYAPSDSNLTAGRPFGEDERLWVESGPHSIGKVYQKALYREYTDESFTTLKPRAPEWEHLGILGPLVRAEVGDTIVVVFKNNVTFPASVHPHGVFYEKDSEGAPYNDGTDDADKGDDGVLPGAMHTYVWPVPERAGPADGDLNSVLWMYHSHTDEVKDVNAGLLAPMIINARGTTSANGAPEGVDREFIVAFDEVFENESWYIQENYETYASSPEDVSFLTDPFGGPVAVPADVSDMGDYNLMASMNGFVYGNQPGLRMRQGEHVRWYLMASTNFEIHAPHWHGNTVEIQGMRTDVAAMLSMGMVIAEMEPDNAGTWLFHCHVGAHLEAGMTSLFTVEEPDVEATP